MFRLVGLKLRTTPNILLSLLGEVLTLVQTVSLLSTSLSDPCSRLLLLSELTRHLVSLCRRGAKLRLLSRRCKALQKEAVLEKGTLLVRLFPSWPPLRSPQLGTLLLPRQLSKELQSALLLLLALALALGALGHLLLGALLPFLLSVGPLRSLVCIWLLSLMVGSLSSPIIRTRRGDSARTRRRVRARIRWEFRVTPPQTT